MLNAAPTLMLCDMDTGAGGWSAFLSRSDGSVNFHSPKWSDLAHEGVGHPSLEFFLSLDSLHHLTSLNEMELLI